MPLDQEPDVPRLALTRAEAARSLGVSVEYFDKHVAPELPVIHRGRRRLYSVEAIKEWLLGNNPAPALASPLVDALEVLPL